MCPVNPRLPLTDRDSPPNDELLDPNREPLIELPVSEAECEPDNEEFPKCEPSMFDTPRFGEIELYVSPLLRPDIDDRLLKLPPCEFVANEGEFPPDREDVPALDDPREAPPAAELPANDLAVEPPAAELPA
jgi:hypothetical protein